MSTMNAYLRRNYTPKEILDRVDVRTNSLVNRLVFDDGDSSMPVVRGVEVVDDRTGKVEILAAEQEVIVCGGAVGSPQLLQLSGIGDKRLLESLSIPVKVDLPDVGRNLEDHLDVYLQYKCRKPVS